MNRRTSSFMQIHRHIYLALYDQAEAKKIAMDELIQNYLIIPLHQSRDWETTSSYEIKETDDANAIFVPSTLAQIYKFDQMIRDVSRKHPGVKLVFCTGIKRLVQLKIAFLLGCHLLMTHCVYLEGVFIAFDPMSDVLDGSCSGTDLQGDDMVQCGWRSLAQARQMEWLNFWEVFDRGDNSECSIMIEEFVHYARFVPAFYGCG